MRCPAFAGLPPFLRLLKQDEAVAQQINGLSDTDRQATLADYHHTQAQTTQAQWRADAATINRSRRLTGGFSPAPPLSKATVGQSAPKRAGKRPIRSRIHKRTEHIGQCRRAGCHRRRTLGDIEDGSRKSVAHTNQFERR